MYTLSCISDSRDASPPWKRGLGNQLVAIMELRGEAANVGLGEN